MQDTASKQGPLKSRLVKLCIALLCIALFVTFGIVLEKEFGFPFYTTYRIACAGICIGLMAKIGSDYPGQRWPWVALSIASVANIALFFTPVVERPASRGEVMLFALPDITIFLAARATSYPVEDDHQRAVRQQLIIGFILAFAFSVILLSLTFIPDRKGRPPMSAMGRQVHHT